MRHVAILAWLCSGCAMGMALRRRVAVELEQLASGQMSAVELAQQWTADRQGRTAPVSCG